MWPRHKLATGRVARTNGYLQNSLKVWLNDFKGWEEDLIFKGGLGAGRKSNPGGLVALTVICKPQ